MNSSDLGLIQRSTRFPALLPPSGVGSGAQGNTPLMWAAANGKGAAVTALVENDASVDLQNKSGTTALIFASSYNHASVVTYLVGVGADQSIKSSRGGTALDWATERGYAEVVAILKNAAEKVRAVRSTSPSLPFF